MLRRSKIQHYRDVESLAIAIGDLRYDAIEELLGLLAIKLRADSILNKDDLTVMDSLINTAVLLDESAVEIKKAFKIEAVHLEKYLPADIKDFIRTNFPTEHYFEAIKRIHDFESEQDWNSETNTFRLSRCLLFLSEGSIKRLKEEVKGVDDYRDLIMQAEYDQNCRMLRNFNNEFGQEHKLETGFEDKDYVNLLETDLPF